MVTKNHYLNPSHNYTYNKDCKMVSNPYKSAYHALLAIPTTL